MSRKTIAAGVVENTEENLRLWVTSPDAIKPGALMPAMQLPKQDIDSLVAYLMSLH
jgi:cytochrome c oxidase subunit 2